MALKKYKCINNYLVDDLLTIGKVYEGAIQDVRYGTIHIAKADDGQNYTFSNKCFEEMKEVKRYFKCIDDSDSERRLIFGKIYEGKDSSSSEEWRILDESKRWGGWYKTRFEEVFDYMPTSNSNKLNSKSQEKIESSDFQFFASVPAGNCPCNILRSVCKYHG